MNGEFQCGLRLRLERGTEKNYRVVVTETELGSIRLLKMDMVGSEADLRAYYNEWCAECGVRNTTTGLVPPGEENNGLLSYSCVVDMDHRRLRSCDADIETGDDEFEVKDDNWYSIYPNDMDELWEIAAGEKNKIAKINQEIRMFLDPDFEIGIMEDRDTISLCGDGKKVFRYWWDMCGICSANPDKEADYPEFSYDRLMILRCHPKIGDGEYRVCSKRI